MDKLRVLFVKPPSNSHLIFPPIGLIQLATCCKGIAGVKILDCLKERYTHREFKEYLIKNPCDVVAISSFSAESMSAIACARIAKKVNPNVITMIGGTHLHNLYKSTSDISFQDIDFSMVGEGEESLPLLLKELMKPAEERSYDHIMGLNYMSNGKIIANEPGWVQNLDGLPNTDWSLIDLKGYPRSYLAKKHPYAPILTSRGCPYRCTFCSIPSIAGRSFRPRSPEKVFAEMKHLYELGVREIMFWDDNFTLQRSRAKRLCELLIEENMKGLVWSCPQGVRIDLIDEELLGLMKKAGCYYVSLGIESGSDRVLTDMKKSISVQKIREKVPLVSKAGIDSWGFFILGYPTETKEDILATINLSREIGLTRVSYHIYQPVSGTEAFDTFFKDKDIDWEKIKFSESLFPPKGMTAQDLKSIQRMAFLRFYCRPKTFLKFLKSNLSVTQFMEIMKMFKEYIIHKEDKLNYKDIDSATQAVKSQEPVIAAPMN